MDEIKVTKENNPQNQSWNLTVEEFIKQGSGRIQNPVVVDMNEVEWLRYFLGNIDLGPTEDDVIESLRSDYEAETGRAAPRW